MKKNRLDCWRERLRAGTCNLFRLSSFVIFTFAAALVVPWIVFFWLASTPEVDHNFAAIAGLILRTLIVLGTGIFLVYQLRRKEQLQIELTSAIEAAKAASSAKSEFLANTSHELRTPLNAIIGFSDIIRSGMFGPLSMRYREYAGDIFNSGSHLLHLINELLDLSKLEAGQFTLFEEDVDIAAIVEASARQVETLAEKHNIELTRQIPGNLPRLFADERRLRQVLINLLANAVKFTPDGGQVSISAVMCDGNAMINVTDTGIGMTKEQIVKALELFGQVDSKISRKHEGSGLGLPLARQLVELHGGHLTIVSRPDIGTTVSVVLPAKRVLPAVEPAQYARTGV